ncbi:MAG: hypothetical protein R2860_06800 [Desulfobacterales bacterium]
MTFDGDGTPENINAWIYDENGNLIRENKDENGDGKRIKFTHGNLMKTEI